MTPLCLLAGATTPTISCWVLMFLRENGKKFMAVLRRGEQSGSEEELEAAQEEAVRGRSQGEAW